MPGGKTRHGTPQFDRAGCRTGDAVDGQPYRLNLLQENAVYGATGGVSENNRRHGFRPAYRDSATGRIAISRFADGRIAPVHVLDGLPEDWVVARDAEGHVCKVLETIHAGFVRSGRFFSREAAVRATDGADQAGTGPAGDPPQAS